MLWQSWGVLFVKHFRRKVACIICLNGTVNGFVNLQFSRQSVNENVVQKPPLTSFPSSGPTVKSSSASWGGALSTARDMKGIYQGIHPRSSGERSLKWPTFLRLGGHVHKFLLFFRPLQNSVRFLWLAILSLAALFASVRFLLRHG